MKNKVSLNAILAIVIVSLFCTTSVNAEEYQPGDIEWISQFGSKVRDEAIAVTATSEGVYVFGGTYGVLPGQYFPNPDEEVGSIFILKYDFFGNIVWTKQIRPDPNPDQPLWKSAWAIDIVSDTTGIYIMGYTNGVFEGQQHYGRADIFVLKLDFDGNQLWASQFGTTDSDAPRALAVHSGNLFVVGATDGRFDEQPLNEYEKNFVLMLNEYGDITWVHRFGIDIYDFNNEWAFDVSADNTGIYVAGQTAGEFPGEQYYGGTDGYLRKYDFAGNVLWTRQFGTPSTDNALGVATDGNNVYVAGETVRAFPGQVKIGGTDIYIRKYDQSGNELWTRQFGTPVDEGSVHIAANEFGVYCAGRTYGVFPGNTSLRSSPYNPDVYVCSYDTNGNQQWVKQFGSSASEVANNIFADSSSVFVAGWTSGILPGQTDPYPCCTYPYGWDAYLVKLNAVSELPPDSVDFSPKVISEGSQLNLTGTAASTSSLPITFNWDFENNGSIDENDSTILFDATTIDGPLNFPIRLIACTGELCTETVENLEIENVPPSADLVLSEHTILTEEEVTASITNVIDISLADQQAGFHYSFDCENDGVFEVTSSEANEYQCSYQLAGTYSLLANIVDKDGGLLVLSDTITVNNPVPPVANAGQDQTTYEGDLVFLNGSQSFDPDGEIVSYLWSFGDGETAIGAEVSHTYQDNGVYEVALEVIDSQGLANSDNMTLIVENVAPSVEITNAPIDPVSVVTSVSIGAIFFDPGVADTFVAVWNWGDDTSSTGTIDNNYVFGDHLYEVPGVYTITLTVVDDDGGEGQAVYQFVVIYDPLGGFATGSGWFESPLGAYLSEPSLSGKASFGFVSKYQKGTQIPEGRTAFQFKTADFKFNSTSFQWLVIAGEKIMIKGSGTVNGMGEYGFMISAIDGDFLGVQGDDLFRIKIWILSTDQIIYDNQLGDLDDEDPTTAISAGSIVIHDN